MGHYTGYKVDIRLHPDIPAQYLAILKWMALGDESDETPHPPLPDHPFFQTRRWGAILVGSSFYFEWKHPPADYPGILTQDEHGYWRVFSVSSTTGWEEDLSKFLLWLMPWIVPGEEEFVYLGQANYEEAAYPMNAIWHAGSLYWTRTKILPDPQPCIGFGYSSDGPRDGYDGRHEFVDDYAMVTDDHDLPEMIKVSETMHVTPRPLQD